MSSGIVTFHQLPVQVSNKVVGYRTTQNLIAGNNTITHNLDLSDPRVLVETRLASTGAVIDVRLVDEDTNFIVLNVAVPSNNVIITIYPINK